MKIKGGDFLIHKTDPSSIFIPEEWNEEQIMLRDMVQDFLSLDMFAYMPMHRASAKMGIVRLT